MIWEDLSFRKKCAVSIGSKEGDSIEFFTDGERIVIEKHNVFSRSMEEIEYMYEILEKMKEGSVLFLP